MNTSRKYRITNARRLLAGAMWSAMEDGRTAERALEDTIQCTKGCYKIMYVPGAQEARDALRGESGEFEERIKAAIESIEGWVE